MKDFFLFCVTTIPLGWFPTLTVAVTLFVPVSITDTLLLLAFVTYTFVPLELTAIPSGPSPTFTVAVTFFVVVLITETLSLPEFATYTLLPSGLTTTPEG